MLKVKSAKELFDSLDEMEYRSVPQNLLFAFGNGDIAYFLGAMAPIRSHYKPYLGNKI